MDAFPNQTVQPDPWHEEKVLAFKEVAEEVQACIESISSEVTEENRLKGLKLERAALKYLISNPNTSIIQAVNDAWTDVFPDKQSESEQSEQERYIKAIVTCRLEEAVDLENLERIRNNRKRLRVLVG